MTDKTSRRRSDSAHLGIVLLIVFLGLLAIGAFSIERVGDFTFTIDGHAASGPVEAIIATIIGVVAAIVGALIAVCAALFGVVMGLFGAFVGVFGALFGVGIALLVVAGPLIVVGLIVWAIIAAATGGSQSTSGRSSLED